MSLEGRLRDLRPLELCQLLSSGRKTGVLLVRAPLHARALELRLVQGAVASASQWPLTRLPTGALEPGVQLDATSARSVADAVLDLLTWREGDFRFVAGIPEGAPPTALRVPMDPLLVEAVQREAVWERVADRVASAQVVPAFVDLDPQQLPLLRLSPQEWETLTRVDGRRDVTALADALSRDVLDIAQLVHGLIGAGLLEIREPAGAPRRHPTPPAQSPAYRETADDVQDGDLWIPSAAHGFVSSEDTTSSSEDLIFDPLTVAVTTAHDVGRRATPVLSDARPCSEGAPVRPGVDAWHEVSPAWRTAEIRVASASGDPSIGTGGSLTMAEPAATRTQSGDEAARRGDLAAALSHWSAALRLSEPPDDADRIREAIALAARLHALLHPHRAAPAVNELTRVG